MSVVTSKQFSLNLPDVWKGLIVAVVAPALLTIYTSLQAGSLSFNWKEIATTAGSAGLAYILKNFFTPAQTVVTPPATQPGTIIPDATVKVTPASSNKN